MVVQLASKIHTHCVPEIQHIFTIFANEKRTLTPNKIDICIIFDVPKIFSVEAKVISRLGQKS